jgi:hypothetical protein
MTEIPNTEAPAEPTFAVVQVPIRRSAFNTSVYRREWRPVKVIDFYRKPDQDQRLQDLQDRRVIQEPTT